MPSSSRVASAGSWVTVRTAEAGLLAAGRRGFAGGAGARAVILEAALAGAAGVAAGAGVDAAAGSGRARGPLSGLRIRDREM